METPHRKPHRTPTEADICVLEKAAWDANVEHVVIWYRDQITQLRERLRESQRALKVEHDQSNSAVQATWKRAAHVVEYFTGRSLDEMDAELDRERP